MLFLPIAVAGLGRLAGTMWGERLLARLSPVTYRRLVGACVAAVEVWLVIRTL